MNSEQALLRLKTALARLLVDAQQADADRARAGQLAKHQAKALFPAGLFRSKGRALVPYVEEMQQALDALERESDAISPRALEARLEHLGDQATALARAIQQYKVADNLGRDKAPILKAVVGRYRPLYEKLSQYREFEQRLELRIRDLKNDSFMTMQHQAEILRQYQRLGRCRQAITELEERLAALEAAWRH
ncbi:primosomal replication protein [Gallaecimonas kandeliae]|uniref:primosomal replication protein PriC n=1 Tax=Gallaecimonas kandeliae TaxID=3029055 RepID=UPI0026471FED|nr:primosomal replication protein PriC [Gallaecimonas kandeliae]WKE64457.1 primosomal replication protein [Gallaecimonas kandeliae]